MAEPILITAPTEEPVTLAEAKAHCRVDDALSDSYIEALIVAAREQAEHALRRKLVTQTWDMVADAFPLNEDAIGIHPDLVAVQSVAQIVYLDPAGTPTTLDPAAYVLDPYTMPGFIKPAAGYSWPTAVADSMNAVKVRVVSGYGAAADVPKSIRQWMLVAIGTMFAQRESIITGTIAVEVPGAFTDALLEPHKVFVR